MNTNYDFGEDARPGAGDDMRHLSADELQQLGVAELAYVKPVMIHGAIAYAIHAADGSPMAVAGNFNMAMSAIHQQDMAATLVH